VPSISPVDSGGENIFLDHNEGIIYRIKPRFNAEINHWWISDDTRYSYKAVHSANRLKQPRRTQYGSQVNTTYGQAIEDAQAGLKEAVTHGPGSLYAVLSPMMACEEAYLLGMYIRSLDPQAVLVIGPIPSTGKNEVFRNPANGKQTFEIQAEKVPNTNGIRRVITKLGGPSCTWDELAANEKPELKSLKAGWIVGGYLSNWQPATPVLPKGFKIVQDILASSLADSADVLLPAAAWAEKDGSWENYQNKIQHFSAAITPVEGARREGDVYYTLLGRPGLYNALVVRQEMGEPFAAVALPDHAAAAPAMEFAAL